MFSPEEKENIKAKICSILIRKPRASKYELAKILKIDKDTALKFKKQVLKKNTETINAQIINEEIGKLEQEYNELALECWQLISNTETREKLDNLGNVISEEDIVSARDKLSAVRALVEAKKVLFNIKFDAGIFEKKLGKLEISEEKTLKDIDKLTIDEKRKFYKKLSEAENIIRNDRTDREG